MSLTAEDVLDAYQEWLGVQKADGEMMYTVVRFFGPPVVAHAEMLDIGQSMNLLREGIFNGLAKGGSGFACSVCMDGSPRAREIHLREIMSFISEFGEIIRRARAFGMIVRFDIAVGPDDRGSVAVYVFTFGPDVLSAIGAAGVELEISMY